MYFSSFSTYFHPQKFESDLIWFDSIRFDCSPAPRYTTIIPRHMQLLTTNGRLTDSNSMQFHSS